MTEMPFDVLNRRLGNLRDNGDIDFDNTAAAVDIDSELQEKFLFFPFAEIDTIAVEQDENYINAGGGAGGLAVDAGASAIEAFAKAENAIAIYLHIRRREDAEDAKRAKRPAPGLYSMGRIIVGVTADQRIMVQQSGTSTFADRTELYDADTIDGADGRAWPLRALGHDFAPLP